VATLLPPRWTGPSIDSPAPLSSYDVVFYVDEQKARVEDDKISWLHTKWFTLKIHSNGADQISRKPLIPFWKGKVHHQHSHHHQWGEVFEPANGKWEALPNPPNYPFEYPECIFMSTALENPSGIIAVYRAKDNDYFDIFYVYDVQRRFWGMLAPVKCKLHRLCDVRWQARAVSVSNTLYWIERPDNEEFKDDILFIAYDLDLDLDLWLEGSLKGHIGAEGRHPGFLRLEKHKFCLLECADDDYLCCAMVEISRMPPTKTLGISVAWDQKHVMEPKKSRRSPTVLAYCDIL